MIPVYSYSDIVHWDVNKKNIIEQYYFNSIQTAKDLGYKPLVYTNSSIFDDKDVTVVKADPNLTFWDGMKLEAINLYDENYFFVDGDITFHNRIILDPNVDMHFDTYEIGNYKTLYKEQVLILDRLGVKELIPEWRVLNMGVINCGFLHFKNQEFKQLYFDRWKKMEEFVEKHNEHLHRSKCTAVAAQYLLTVLTIHYNIKTKHFSDQLRKPNYFYTHHAGKEKWKSRKVLEKNSII